MDFVNLWYKYMNRMINSTKLLDELESLDLSKYTNEEVKEIQKLILQVKNIKNTVPNEVDDIEKERISKIESMLKRLGEGQNEDEKVKNFRNELYKERESKRDGGKLYQEIYKLLSQNTLVNKYAHEMNAKETLELITQYISVPVPPNLTQEAFNDLVQMGIEEDKREALWRLAVNYSYSKGNMDFTLIVDYFIKKRDTYYLLELMHAVEEGNIDKKQTFKKVLATGEEEFIHTFMEKGKEYSIIIDDEM